MLDGGSTETYASKWLMFRPTALVLRLTSLGAGLLVLACGGAAVSPTPSPGQRTALTVSYSEIVADELAPWGAKDGGFFDKNGLDVELQNISSTNGVPALLSGQVQIAQIGGSEVISAAAGGGDLVIIATLAPVFPYLFMAAKEITNVDQLKGKKVGISRQGGSADIATRAGLQREGLDPNKDVTIVETGSAANRVAALRAGAIHGGVSQPPETTLLQQQGFNVLFDLAKLKLPAANTVVATTGTYLKAHRQVIQLYIDSLIQALAKERKDKAFTLQVLQKWAKMTDQASLDDSYNFYLHEVFPAYPYPRPEQYAAAIEVLKPKNPRLQGFDVSKVLDASFVKNANDRKVGG